MTSLDRIKACLYGGALGDALGYAVEFSAWDEIRSEYGENGILEPELTGGKALISDDTQMTLFTAEGMLTAKENGIDLTDGIYQAYLCWLDTQGYMTSPELVCALKDDPVMRHRRAPGNTCVGSLLSGRMGTIAQPLNDSRGCGGVMRSAPLGFISGSLENGARSAAITHGSPLGWLPAGMLSDMVYRCLFGNHGSLREITEASLSETERVYGGYDETAAFCSLMRRAIDMSLSPFGGREAILALGEGWTGHEALAIAVYCALCYPTDMKSALIAAVNHDGDSNSTGAVTGNIVGTYTGCYPADWAGKIEVREEIEDISLRLSAII